MFAVIGMTQMDISDDMVMSKQKTKGKEKHLILLFSFQLMCGWTATVSDPLLKILRFVSRL